MNNLPNFDKFYLVIEKVVSNSNFYIQSIALSSCFILAFLCYKLVRNYIFPKLASKALKKNADLNLLVTRYFLPLLYPVFAVIFLAIGLSIYAEFFLEALIFTTTLKLTILFLFLRFLRISSNNNFIANAAGIFLFPALLLDVFGLLDSTISYLDQYALHIGTFRISVYLVIKGFTVLLLVFWLSGLVSKKSKSFIESSKNIKSGTKIIITKFLDIFIYSIVGLTILKTFGVDMTALAVIGGAVGVGIGFGLQKIASNFISGIILLFERSVEVGDMVEIDRGDIFGTVKYFGGRYTLVEAIDGKEVMIPNEDFIIGKVTNWTFSNNRVRIEIPVGISYASDLNKAKKIMLDAANNHERCLGYPAAECFITDFADSSINLVLHFWVSDIVEGRMGPKSDIMLEIWEKFKENDITIPFPQREVKMV